MFNRVIIERAIKRQQSIFKSSFLLNPAENLPAVADLQPYSSFLQGLYVFDNDPPEGELESAKIIFGGRKKGNKLFQKISQEWATKLNAVEISFVLKLNPIISWVNLGSKSSSPLYCLI